MSMYVFTDNYKSCSWLFKADRLSTICSHKPVLYFGILSIRRILDVEEEGDVLRGRMA